MYRFDTNGQMTMLGLDTAERGGAPPKRRPGKPDSELVSIPYFHLDLLSSPVDLFGQRHWELRSPWREGKRPLNTGAAPRRPIRVSLSGILEAYPSLKYYLSKTACLGILRRAFERGKKLPKMLARALKIQAGLMKPDSQPTDLKAFHVNQRNEGIDLNGVSGALMATTNMQMQTSVTQPNGAGEGFDGYDGVMAFAANQRDEVRDLRDVAGALGAQPGMKQQTFVLQGNMIGRKDENGPQGDGVNKDVCFTLDATDRHAVCAPEDVYAMTTGSYMQVAKEVAPTLMARDYKDPTTVAPVPHLNEGVMGTVATGAHPSGFNGQDAFNDRLVIDNPEAQPTPVTYTIRRLTPTECARLQGFPDWWCRNLGTEDPTEEELTFWADVFETHRKIVTHAKKPKTEKQIRKWLADPYTDSAEYRIWGNGICLANAFFVLAGIAWCAGLEE